METIYMCTVVMSIRYEDGRDRPLVLMNTSLFILDAVTANAFLGFLKEPYQVV